MSLQFRTLLLRALEEYALLGISECAQYQNILLTHIHIFGALLGQNYIRQQVRSIRFLYNVYHSKNAIVRSCFNHAILDANLCMGAKLAFLRTTGIDIFKQKLYDAIKQVPQLRITVEQQADIENLGNVMFVRSEQSFIEGFDNTEIDCMI